MESDRVSNYFENDAIQNAVFLQSNENPIKIADYHSESNIVYCALNECYMPLNFCSIPFHYSRKHKLKICDAELRTVLSTINSLIDEDRVSTAMEYTTTLTRNELAPLPMLEIKNGIECLLCPDDEVYYCIKKNMMRAHYSRKHNGSAQVVRPANVQCFNSKLKTPCFKVRTVRNEAITTTNLNANFLTRKFFETNNHAYTSASPKRKTYIEELQLDKAISDVPSPTILNLDYQHVLQKTFLESIFKKYFMLGYDLLDKPNECSFLLKRHVRDPHQDQNSNRVMKNFRNESTLAAYIKQGCELLLFLYACKHEMETSGRKLYFFNCFRKFCHHNR